MKPAAAFILFVLVVFALLVFPLRVSLVATAHADPIVRHATFSGGSTVSRGAGHLLGSSVGQSFAGARMGFWALVGSVGAGPGGGHPLETEFLLGVSAPNPFRDATSLHFALPEAAPVRLLVHDANGRVVRRLLDAKVDAGPHDLVWDGRDDAGRRLPAGVYLCRIQTPGFRETKKLVRVP